MELKRTFIETCMANDRRGIYLLEPPRIYGQRGKDTATRNRYGQEICVRNKRHSPFVRCSMPTANRIKKSGKISKAITQIGRKIIVDAELALELAGHKSGGRK